MAEDVIAAMLRRLRELAPATADTIGTRLEDSLRAQYGGRATYNKKATAQGKAQRLGEALAQRLPLGAAMKEAGVSKSAAYRLLARRWRR